MLRASLLGWTVTGVAGHLLVVDDGDDDGGGDGFERFCVFFVLVTPLLRPLCRNIVVTQRRKCMYSVYVYVCSSCFFADQSLLHERAQ